MATLTLIKQSPLPKQKPVVKKAPLTKANKNVARPLPGFVEMSKPRNTVRRKVLGRGQVVAAIRTAIYYLDKAKSAANQTDRDDSIQRATKCLKDTAETLDIFGIDRKKLRAAIERETKHLTDLMEWAKSVPLTANEKHAARAKKENRHGL